MAYYSLLLLGLMASLAALANWRKGLLWMIVLANLQDPLRKLVPGTPGNLLLITLVVVIAAGIGMFSCLRRPWSQFAAFHTAIRKSLNYFILAILPAALISLTYGPGSWAFTAFGVISYGIILLSILLGYFYVRSPADIKRFLIFYSIVTTTALIGTYLEYFNIGFLNGLIGADALGYEWIRHKSGYMIRMLSGFYRSPDVMGWHAAATSMISLILVFTGKGSGRWRWLVVTAIGVGALMVSGRRKMVYMIPLFIILVPGLMIYCRRRGLGINAIIPLALPIIIAFIIGNWLGAESEFVRYYTDDPGDISVQSQNHLWGSVVGTFQQSGFWGSGFGFASPGAQNIPFARPRIWQESGASRLMVELGLPGMLAFLGLTLEFFRSALRTARMQVASQNQGSLLCISLLAFVFANFASLGISGQILADPFIASFIGISLGMQLSFVRIGVPFSATIQRSEASPLLAAKAL